LEETGPKALLFPAKPRVSEGNQADCGDRLDNAVPQDQRPKYRAGLSRAFSRDCGRVNNSQRLMSTRKAQRRFMIVES
jgi:hypothetical protein